MHAMWLIFIFDVINKQIGRMSWQHREKFKTSNLSETRQYLNIIIWYFFYQFYKPDNFITFQLDHPIVIQTVWQCPLNLICQFWTLSIQSMKKVDGSDGQKRISYHAFLDGQTIITPILFYYLKMFALSSYTTNLEIHKD